MSEHFVGDEAMTIARDVAHEWNVCDPPTSIPPDAVREILEKAVPEIARQILGEIAGKLDLAIPYDDPGWAVGTIKAHLDERLMPDGAHLEYIVCHAAGYPGPYAPWPNTLEHAQRFADEHSMNMATGKPVSPVIKKRMVSDWEVVEVLNG